MKRKALFNTFAEDYKKFRPCYSKEFAQTIINTIGLNPQSKLLEIGCGTGQATAAFQNLGCEIIALDIGSELIDLAKKDLPQVDFQLSSFEDFESVPESFDMIYSAMAFHWIRPDIGFKKSASLLKQNGYLILMEIERQFTGPIQKKIDCIYQDFSTDFAAIEKIHEGITPTKVEMLKEWSFVEKETIELFNYQKYSSGSYLGLIKTMSDHRALENRTQEELYKRLKNVFTEKDFEIECKNIMRARVLQKK